jgi:hypothetical protein
MSASDDSSNSGPGAKPRDQFDEILDHARADTRRRHEKTTHADLVRERMEAERRARAAETHGPAGRGVTPKPQPEDPGVTIELNADGRVVRPRRFLRRYNWRKAARLMADGMEWRDAANAIGCDQRSMLRMMRHSAQFRSMMAEERRMQHERIEREFEKNLLRVNKLIEDQLRRGDGATVRWMARRALGTRPNEIARTFEATLPEAPPSRRAAHRTVANRGEERRKVANGGEQRRSEAKTLEECGETPASIGRVAESQPVKSKA